MKNKIAVIAKDYQQFKYFLTEVFPNDRDSFIYMDINHLRGYKFSAVIRVGAYFENRHWQELYDEALRNTI